MRKTNIVLFVMLIFSIVADVTLAIGDVYGETNEIQLVDDPFLKVSYQCESLAAGNRWQLTTDHRTPKEGHTQRMKFRITDEKENIIDYPKMNQMVEKDGWLMEKEFSSEKKEKRTIDLSKSIKKLSLYVQMDQQDSSGKIQENILERSEPFLLESVQNEVAKSIDSSEKSVINEDKNNSSSHTFGPKAETQDRVNESHSLSANGTSRMYSPIYTNKEPNYKKDAGTYPEFSWQPSGQTNVINHQGGIEGQTGWDGESSWDVGSDDYTKSYIKYGEDPSKPNIQLRKYAQEVPGNPDQFKVKLNVRGNITYKPGVDIVFLLDNSGSMAHSGTNRKKNAVDALEKIINELSKNADIDAQNIRVGGHIFGGYIKSNEDDWNWTRAKTYHKLSSNPANWTKMKNDYNSLTPVGQTFTQRALQEAQDVFEEPSTNLGKRHKLLFHLTDGAPNMAWKPLTVKSDPLMYYDKVRVLTSDQGQKGSYNPYHQFSSYSYSTNVKFIKPYPVGGQQINSYLTMTNSKAWDLKESGIEIHTIAVQITTSGSNEHSPTEIQKGLYKMATKKANTTSDGKDDYFYYHANDSSELMNQFKEWYDTVIRTVDKGTITDPLGDMVELVGNPTWRQVVNGKPQIAEGDKPSISLEDSGRTIKVNNINLTNNQEIEVEYIVRLKTTDNSFTSGKWYPANGRTYLEPTPERTNDKLDFGVPSVKYQRDDFVIPVEKIWTDKNNQTDNYWGMRPTKITVALQKQNGSSWTALESIDLNAANNWKGAFASVEGGAENVYRVIEPSRTNGYKKPTISQESFTSETLNSGGIKVTNELLTGDHEFWKFMEDGSTKFTTDLPKFKVTRSNGKVLAENLTPNTTTGKVTLKNIPVGDYTVEETYVPQGYKQMPNFTINVTENNSSSPTGLVFKVNGSTSDHHVRNELKDFSLIVEKVDEKGEWLDDATFKLTGPNNYEQTIAGGPFHDFFWLRPGKYTLTETVSPKNYELLNSPVTFEIGHDGTVTVDEHPQASGSGDMTGADNLIHLTVTNKRVQPGILPRTGGYGKQGIVFAAGLFVLAGAVLSTTSLYLNRRKK